MSELDPRQWLRALPDLARLTWGLARDRRVALPWRIALGALVAYVASPIDLVPEWVPLAGQIDDAIVFVAGIRTILRRIDEGVLVERWPGDPAVLGRLIGKLLPGRPSLSE